MPQNTASDQVLHCLLTGVSFKIQIKWKIPSSNPNIIIGNGLVQLIRMGKYIWHNWIKTNGIFHKVWYSQVSILRGDPASQVVISNKYCISFTEDRFCLSKQCRPWWNATLYSADPDEMPHYTANSEATLCGISSRSSLFAKVPI